jgi:hypothetical protein
VAHYDALIAAWNNPTQPPPGVTGSGLLPADTTDQKITKVNAWTVTGSVPTTVHVTSDQLANCVNYPEFKALTAVQQSNLLGLFNIAPGQLLGGSANTSFLTVGMIIDYFPAGGATITSLTALSKGLTQLWWQAPVANNGGGLTSPVSIDDTKAAGLV